MQLQRINGENYCKTIMNVINFTQLFGNHESTFYYSFYIVLSYFSWLYFSKFSFSLSFVLNSLPRLNHVTERYFYFLTTRYEYEIF